MLYIVMSYVRKVTDQLQMYKYGLFILQHYRRLFSRLFPTLPPWDINKHYVAATQRMMRRWPLFCAVLCPAVDRRLDRMYTILK